jgi:hypothetical protein
LGEHFGTRFIWTCISTVLRCTILISPQIVFNIEKLISIICKSCPHQQMYRYILNKIYLEQFILLKYRSVYINTFNKQDILCANITVNKITREHLCCTGGGPMCVPMIFHVAVLHPYCLTLHLLLS